MDEELLELQRQFESAQQAKSSIRLSERNVVELVQKLQHLHIIECAQQAKLQFTPKTICRTTVEAKVHLISSNSVKTHIEGDDNHDIRCENIAEKDVCDEEIEAEDLERRMWKDRIKLRRIKGVQIGSEHRLGSDV
ncbi:hypothetical protein L1987_12791 [Smallanthus sonchifolius]|uniref:Uncharacterized protein n=1 Tax=Smallanthus sonchifolius TaxID=185202 RepID=A0ACB9JF57_9ASTR|nr:hypothetical protein L1987_12791 [Smallanthus sonchifolius]